jgi:hypothetical protein
MMKNFVKASILLLIWSAPGSSLYSQLPTVKNNKLLYTATVITDSGSAKGYLWHVSDSAVYITYSRTLDAAGYPRDLKVLPEGYISSMTIRRKKLNWTYPVAGAVLGFILGAGLIGAVNNPQESPSGDAFLDLVWYAVVGSTDSDIKRRKAALYIGGGTALTLFTVGLFSSPKLKVDLPLTSRKNSLKNKRQDIDEFILNY